MKDRISDHRRRNLVWGGLLTALLLAAGYGMLGPAPASGPVERMGWDAFPAPKARDAYAFLCGAQMLLLGCLAPGQGLRSLRLAWSRRAGDSPRASLLRETLPWFLLAGLPVTLGLGLYGGVHPLRVAAAGLLALYVWYILAAAAVLFRKGLRRHGTAMVAAYAVPLLMFAGTGTAASLLSPSGGDRLAGFLLGLNPMGALLSILNGDYSDEVFGSAHAMPLWLIFVPAYAAALLILVLLAAKRSRPVRMRAAPPSR